MIIQGTAIKGMTVSSSAATVEPDSYFNLVSLLLPGNGTNGAQNNTFLDSSTNNFTVTRNGNPTQGTFSPFSQTGWSNYFNGSSQLVITSTSAAFDISGDFTVECWILGNDIDGQVLAIEQNTSPEYAAVQVQLSSNVYILNISQTGSSWAISQNTGVTNPNNSWNHIAVTRSGTSVKMFLNGTSIFSTTVSGALYSSGARSIINGRFGAAYFTGYVSNFRFVNGAALYTSNFTPPTEPLTTTSQGATAAQVELLTCQSNRFIDSSDNNFTITVSGTPQVLAVAPFNPTTAYAAGTVGGSGYFDGSGDYLDAGAQTAFAFGTGSWTVEAWVYVTSLSSEILLFDTRSSISTAGVGCRIGTDGTLSYSGSANNPLTSTAIKTNEWNHIAWSYDGTTLSGYINGVRGGTATPSFNISQNNGIVGRVGFTAASYMSGYISSLRVVKGSAVYSGTSFSVPTAPLTAISGTSLLLSGTNGGITDAAAKNVLETVGGASISTAQSKWGGSAMAFDGSGDWLINPPSAQNQLGTGDFTVEFWFYSTSSADVGIFNISATSSSGSAGMAITKNTSNQLTFWVNGNGGQTITAATYSINTWHHVALVRNGSTNTLYVNGVSAASNSNTPTWASTPCIGVGRPYNDNTIGAYIGYINDLRITRGYARYTTNFTPPTSAFPTQ